MTLLARIEYRGKSYSPFQIMGTNNYYQKNGIIAKFQYFLKEKDFYNIADEDLILENFSSVKEEDLVLSQSAGRFSISKESPETLVIQ